MTCLCAAAKNAQHWRLATQLADALAPTNSAATAARRAGRWMGLGMELDLGMSQMAYDMPSPRMVHNDMERYTCDVAHSSACCDRWQMYTTRFHRCSQLDHHKGLWCPELSSSWMHLAITILWMTWIFTQHPVSLRNLKPPYPRSTWLGFC